MSAAPDALSLPLDGIRAVEASAGRMAGTGVYDLGVDPSPGQWRLLRVAD